MMLDFFDRVSENRRALVIILFISTVLKVVLAFSNRVINPDGDDIIWAAQQFMEGHFSEGLALTPSAFHSLLIAAAHLAIPDWLIAARFISISMSVLVLIPLYLITKELFGRKAAFWSCLLFTVSPCPNEWSLEIIRGPSYLFFFSWGVYFAIKSMGSGKVHHFLLTAFFAMVSLLLREEAIVLVPVFFIAVLCLALWRTKERKGLLKGLSLSVGIAILVLAGFSLASGPEGGTLKVIGKIKGEAVDVIDLEFLNNYRQIYDQLKILEKSSPYPKGSRNLAELARHYMPVLYLFGVIQGLIKVVFPLFVIPLILGMRQSLDRNRIFLMALTGFYLFVLYYRLIDKDFIQNRFLFAPAFLLYPWIGKGTERILSFLKTSRWQGIACSVFLAFFILLPVYISTGVFREPDSSIPEAGLWLAGREEYSDLVLLSTDSRIPFYAGRKIECGRYEGDRQDYESLQRYSIEKGAEILAIRLSGKREEQAPDLEFFNKTKEFRGEKDAVFFYVRRGPSKTGGGEEE